MFISDAKLKDILLSAEVISVEQWQMTETNARRLGVSVKDLLREQDIIFGHLLYEVIAKAIGVEYINLHSEEIPPEVLVLLDAKTVNEYKIIPVRFDKKKKELVVAALNPFDKEGIRVVAKKIKGTVKVLLCGDEGFRFAARYYQKDIIDRLRVDFQKTAKGAQDPEALFGKLAEYIYYLQPSDIHCDPTDGAGVIKMRVDGFLRDEFPVSRAVLNGLCGAIKKWSHVSTASGRLSLDGRFSCTVLSEELGFRVSVMPTYYGEKIVLRVLDASKQKMSLRDLGFSDEQARRVRESLQRPFGLTIVSGPTGSGKSSTLYTVLKSLNVEGVSLVTVEDPVEYSIPHISQTQVDEGAGYGFAEGLKSLLRQDPNIIMVGEVRDESTADTTVQAALTGHTVLTSLHANSAAGTVTRLLDMGIKPYLLAPVLNLCVCQRLAKRICLYCRESYTPPADLMAKLEKDRGIGGALAHLESLGYLARGSGKSLLLFRGKGCPKCGLKGLKGRIGLFELLEVSKGLRNAMEKGVSESELESLSRRDGALSLFEDGLLKAIQGHTTLEEVLRVTG